MNKRVNERISRANNINDAPVNKHARKTNRANVTKSRRRKQTHVSRVLLTGRGSRVVLDPFTRIKIKIEKKEDFFKIVHI